MAAILCVTTGLLGMTYASVELCRRLASDGHSITYGATLDVGDIVSRAGVTWAPLEPLRTNPTPEVEARGRAHRKWREWRTRHARSDEALRHLHASIASFERLLDASAFDLVLVDVELAEHVFALVRRRQRFALLTPWFETQRRPGLPPITTSIVPGRGVAGTELGLRAAWLRQRTSKRVRRAKVWARYFGTDRRSVLAREARALGVPRRALHPDDWVTMFGMEGWSTLRMTDPDLEFPHAARPEVRTIGPQVLPGSFRRENAAVREEVEDWARATVAAGRRLVYVAASSMSQRDTSFLERVVRAGVRMEGVALLVGCGGGAEVAERCRGAAGTHEATLVLNSAPADVALGHAEVVLHHAGIHTIHEALEAGVRQIVYSGHEADQDGCAARLAHRGLAVLGSREHETSDDIADRIRTALDDRALAAAATRAAEGARTQREQRLPESAVRALLEDGRGEGPT